MGGGLCLIGYTPQVIPGGDRKPGGMGGGGGNYRDVLLFRVGNKEGRKQETEIYRDKERDTERQRDRKRHKEREREREREREIIG